MNVVARRLTLEARADQDEWAALRLAGP